MLILLPPSETKRPGGGGLSLSETGLGASHLSFSTQNEQRQGLLDALTLLSRDERESARVLKLGPKQLGETQVNAAVWDSPTMPAIARFTGVLYDAIEVETLDANARAFIDAHVLIQSALFGLIRAGDEIPEYRLSFDARVPGIGALKNFWAPSGPAVLTSLLDGGPESNEPAGLVLDLRSEGYAALAPLPDHPDAYFVRAVGRATNGELRQLNHFNKKGKGVFVQKLASTFPGWWSSYSGENPPASVELKNVLAWAQANDVELSELSGDRSLQLVINEADYPPLSAR
jgi:cytoplasmic iron level regulating protein YaaA (DUF328/UPF0246 family)